MFRAHAYRLGNNDTDTCMYCGKEDNVEHAIFECPKWHNRRDTDHRSLGKALASENFVPEMIKSAET